MGDIPVGKATVTSLVREAHTARDSVIDHWTHLLRTGDLRHRPRDPIGNAMRRFKRYGPEEVRKLNELQAAYFDRHVHAFDPPLPQGVPERLREIVRAGRITGSDSVLDVGTGTGILIPLLQEYAPARIYANDLSRAMLEAVEEPYPYVIRKAGDVSDLDLPDESIDVVFINACYANIVDKHNAFTNIQRMFRPGGRLVISHPLGRSFVSALKQKVPFPLDEFPADASEAQGLFAPYGLRVSLFLDEEKLYILRLESPAAG